jgi:predicted RNA polymerase sigma factor
MALMCLNASRLNARTNPDGDLCTLENQDRAKWDAESIEWGFYFLKQAARGNRISQYHIEAGIASQYATAPSFEETDWQAILDLYNLLVKWRENFLRVK